MSLILREIILEDKKEIEEMALLLEIYFNNKLVFDGNWNCPELFKLEFDDNNNLSDIKNLR